MVRKEAACQNLNPSKRTKFSIRGQPVNRAKIERFKANHPCLRYTRSGNRFLSEAMEDLLIVS